MQSRRKGCALAHVHGTKCALPNLTVLKNSACLALGKTFSRQHLEMFFVILFFFQKTGFDSLCKLTQLYI